MPVKPPEDFTPNMTVQQVKDEVQLLNLDNIRHFPISESKKDDFYSLWNKYGPQAGRDVLIPLVWYGYCPKPSLYFG